MCGCAAAMWKRCDCKSIEPPRLFEALLRGRAWRRFPTSWPGSAGFARWPIRCRRCMPWKRALGSKLRHVIRTLRRLLYCGEWIESHALHVHLLHAPDFLGYESGLSMAQDYREEVNRGLQTEETRQSIAGSSGRPGHSSHQCGGRWLLSLSPARRIGGLDPAFRMGRRGGRRHHALGRRLRFPRLRAEV